jgi:arylsulfatase A-like enzyme
MALFFYDGLEANRTTATLGNVFDSVWSVIPASQSYATCVGRHGGSGTAVVGANLFIGKDHVAHTGCTTGIRFQFPTPLAGQSVALEVFDSSGPTGPAIQFKAVDNGDGTFHVLFSEDEGGVVFEDSGPLAIDPARWYFMELSVAGLSSSPTGLIQFECRINRDVVIKHSRSLAMADWESIALRVSPGAGTCNIDDFYALDSDPGHRTFLGPDYTVSTQYPVANGDVTEWTVSPASQTHAAAVDDALFVEGVQTGGLVDDDSSFVTSDSDTTLDLFRLSSDSELGGHVVDTKIEVYARTDAAGSGEPLPIVTRFRGEALEVENIALTDAYSRTSFQLGGLPGSTKGLSPEDLRHFQAGVGDATVAAAPGGSIGIGNYNVVFAYLDDWGIDSSPLYHDQNPYKRGSGVKYTQAELEDTLIYPKTPEMQAMASEGIIFDRFRATPVCSSGRWSILTGRYPFRHGCGNIPSTDPTEPWECGVDPLWGEFPISQVVRTQGYRSAMIGKAHLMAWDLSDPTGHGTNGVPGEVPGQGWSWMDAYSYFDHYSVTFHNTPASPPVPQAGSYPAGGVGNFENYFIYRNDTEATQGIGSGTETDETQYITNRQYDDAMAFLATNVNEKFVLYLPFSAPHGPSTRSPFYQTTDSYRSSVLDDGSLFNNFNLCVETIDLRLKDMRDWMKLNHPAAYARTVWVVAGDNGTTNQVLNNARDKVNGLNNANSLAPGVAEAHPTKGGINLGTDYDAMLDLPQGNFKLSVYDRGVLCPLIISGPSDLISSPNRRCGALVDYVDLFALIAELTNTTVTDTITDGRILDGVSMLPLLVDETVDLESHARQTSFTTYFAPNGNVNDIVAPEAEGNVVRHAYCALFGTPGAKVVWKLIRYLDSEELYNLATNPFETGGSLPLSGTEYDSLTAGLDALLASEPRINGGGVIPGTLTMPITDQNNLPGTVVLDINDKLPITDSGGVAGTVDSVGGTHIPITDSAGFAGQVLLEGQVPTGQTILPVLDSSGTAGRVALDEPSNDLPITDSAGNPGIVVTSVDGTIMNITDSAGIAGTVALQEE